MIVVVRRDFVFLPNAPSKKLLVKPARAILIGRAQVSDTECTGKAFNAEATAGPRLPQGEDGSDRVLQYRHASEVVHIKGLGDHLRAESSRTAGSGVGVLDRNVKIPVRRNDPRPLLRTERVRSCHIRSEERRVGKDWSER